MDLSNIWVSSLVLNILYYGNWFTTFSCKWDKVRCEAKGQGMYVEEVASLNTTLENLVEE